MKMKFAAIFCICAALITPLESASDVIFNKIRHTNSITIGISENYPPLNFLKQGKRIGIEMSMIQSLTEFLGVDHNKIKLVYVNPADYIPFIEKQKVDIVVAGMSRNLARSKKIWFSDPYLTFSPAIIIDRNILPKAEYGEFYEDKTYRTLWDLKQMNKVKVAVKSASVYVELITGEFPNMEVILVNTNEEAIKLLKQSKIQGYVHDSIYLEQLMRQKPELSGRYLVLHGGPRKEYLCIGMAIGETSLLHQVNAWIGEVQRVGLLDKWILEYTQ